MTEILGHGKIIVEVEENVQRELAKARAAFQKTMDDLDGREATLRLDANTKDFYAKTKKAQADLEKWEQKKASATLDVDVRQANAGIANATGRLQRYEKENVKVFQRIVKLDRDREAAHAKMVGAVEAGERKITKAKESELAKQTKANADALAKQTKDQEAADAARERSFKKVEGKITKLARDGSKIRTRYVAQEAREEKALARQREQIFNTSAALERRYIALREKRQRLEKKQRGMFLAPSDRIKLDFDVADLDQQIGLIEAKLATIGKPPPEIEIHLDEQGAGAARLSRWSKLLTETTVRLGPFTTTIGGAVRALAMFGPIITGIVGSLGALVGVVGSAAIGFGGALTAGLGAFGLVLGSTALLMKPLLKDFKTLSGLQKAYHKALLEGNEDKAAKKLKELNHALGAVSPTTRKAFQDIGTLGDDLDKLAVKSRPDFLNAFGEGIATARASLTRFGPEVTQSFGLVSRGVQSMFKSLRGAEASNIFQTLFDQGQKALPAFGRGLGNIAASLGRIGSGFSRVLPGLMGGFESWTDRFVDFTRDGSKLSKFVDKTTRSLRSLGNFLQSSAGFLGAFFGAGVQSGVSLLDRMAGGLDKITNSIRANPRGLQDFFGDSVDTVTRLFNALKPMAALFIEWATLMTPFTNILLDVLSVFAGLAAAIAGFGPVRGVLQAAFGIFLVGALVGKIAAVTTAVRALAASMMALGGAGAAAKFGSALTAGALAPIAAGVGRTAPAVAAGGRGGPAVRRGPGVIDYTTVGAAPAAGNVTKTATAMSRGAKAATALRVGLTGVGAVLGFANPIFGAAALGALALGAGYVVLRNRAQQAGKDLTASRDATMRSADAYRSSVGTLADYNSNLQRSSLIVRQARRDLSAAKKGTDEYKLAKLNLSDAERAHAQSQIQVRNNARENIRLADEQVDRARKQVQDQEKYDKQTIGNMQKRVDHLKQQQDPNLPKMKHLIEAEKQLADAIATRDGRVSELERSLNRQAAAELNNIRATKGMLPLMGAAEQAVGKYARAAGKASAQKIAVNFKDSGDAGKVAAAAGRAIKAGVPKNVATRIAVSTKDAEAAVKRLNSAKLTPKRLKIVEDGGRKAISMVQQLTGLKLGPKRQKIIEEGGRPALALLSQLLGIKLSPKTQQTNERGAAVVLGALGRITGFQLPNKTMSAILRDLASGKIRSVQGLINSLPASRTTTLTTVHRHVVVGDRVVGKGRFAQGGVIAAASGFGSVNAGGRSGSRRIAGDAYTSPALERTISAALDTASAPRKSKGEVVSKPQFLVGEQRGKPEFIIATNPAFRDRNERLLSSAAARFGKRVIPAAGGWGPDIDVTTTGGYNAPMSPGKAPPPPQRGVGKTIKRKGKNYKKNRTKGLRSGRAWVNYIEGLQTQQDDLGREVSIRQGAVQEPEDLIVEVGRIITKDPQTGKDVDVGPQMGPNTAAIDIYKAGLAHVRLAMDAMISVIQALIVGIPKALEAIRIEDIYRSNNIAALREPIRNDSKLIRNLEGKSKLTDDQKEALKRAKARLKRNEDRRDDEKEKRATIREDRGKLNESYKDAGFDLREVQQDREGVHAEHEGVAGRALTESGEANKQTTGSPGGGAGGGSGSDVPGIGQQTGLADTERARIAQQYGGNMSGVTLGGAIGSASAGPQGALNPNAGAGTNDPFSGGTSGAFSSGGTGGGAGANFAAGMAGGKAAGQAMAPTGNTYGAKNGAAGAGSTVNQTTVVNNFQSQPSDPLTWSKGIEFELGATV